MTAPMGSMASRVPPTKPAALPPPPLPPAPAGLADALATGRRAGDDGLAADDGLTYG